MKQKKRGKGQDSRPGTPHPSANGRWVQWITDDDGKRHKRTGATKREVSDKITVLLADLKSPERQKAKEQGPTLAELSEHVLAKRDGATHRVYSIALTHWRKLLGSDTRRLAVTGPAVQAAVDELAATKAPKTVETYYAALRVALEADHPALKKIVLPKEDDEEEEDTRIVPSDIAARLQTAAQYHPQGIALGLGFGAGVRAGEAAALRWQDVDVGRMRLSINATIKPGDSGWVRGKTKGRKTRFVTLDNDRIDWLQRHRRIQVDTAALAGYPAPEFVIADPATGQRVDRTIPVKVLRALLAEVCTLEEYAQFGDLRFHALRHTHISELLAQGVGVADLAARVGQTPETLLRYYAHAVLNADQHLAALAGQLFPVLAPEATRQATHPGSTAAQRGGNFIVCKREQIRATPQNPAESAEEPDPSPRNIRTEPQEPAAVSNLVSNPTEKTGGVA